MLPPIKTQHHLQRRHYNHPKSFSIVATVIPKTSKHLLTSMPLSFATTQTLHVRLLRKKTDRLDENPKLGLIKTFSNANDRVMSLKPGEDPAYNTALSWDWHNNGYDMEENRKPCPPSCPSYPTLEYNHQSNPSSKTTDLIIVYVIAVPWRRNRRESKSREVKQITSMSMGQSFFLTREMKEIGRAHV